MPKRNPGVPAQRELEDVLSELLDLFRDRLVTKAEGIARERRTDLSAEHFQEAYDRFLKSKAARAKAATVVQRQFRYNRFWEWTTFAMACFLFMMAVAALLYGFFGGSEVGARITTVAGGSFLQLLVFIPLRMTVVTRRHNFAIAIFAHLLDRVDDPAAVAVLCRKMLDELAAKHSAP